MSHHLENSATLALLLPSCNAWAGEQDDSSVSLDGFGTLGVLNSACRKADFVTNKPFLPAVSAIPAG